MTVKTAKTAGFCFGVERAVNTVYEALDKGGDIYTYNGSHGCVNLPHDVALKLYDMVDIGTMVVVH